MKKSLFLPNNLDRLSSDSIKEIQNELLRETLTYAHQQSPYYREIFEKSKIKPHDIKDIDGIKMLPVTCREDLQRDHLKFLAVPMHEIAEIGSTTGTTGDPCFIALTARDLERLAYNEARSFSYTGVKKGDLFHIAVTCDNLFIAGIAYYSGLLKLGASVVRIGPQSIIRHLNLIKKVNPTGIVAVPSFIMQMLRRINKDHITSKDLGIEKLVLIGDSIRNIDCSSNTLGTSIEDAFGKICYSTYGITEAQVSFCECEFRHGLHSQPEFVLAEILDDDGNVLPDGRIGELALTTLQLEGMPLIRFKTGDITFCMSGQCSCGRHSVRIGPILGRKQHKLKVKGVTLYPKTIENVLLSLEHVVNYQIEAFTGDDQTDHIILRIGIYNKDKSMLESLSEELRAKARVTPLIEIEPPEEIEKRLFENGSRKPIIFKDSRVNLYG